jgi:hypothetical protein
MILEKMIREKKCHTSLILGAICVALFTSQSCFATPRVMKKGAKTSIIGSYRKFYPEIRDKIEDFEKIGVKVLMPPKSHIINPGEEFIRFANDKGDPIEHIEAEFLKAVTASDFVYVVDVAGYIGTSSALEIGYAHALKKPIYCMMKPTDITIEKLCTAIVPSIE